MKESEWGSGRKDLVAEIRRQWEDYIKPTLYSTEDKGPHPTSWDKAKLLEWLQENAISNLGNASTTQEADCQFICAVMARTQLLQISSTAEKAAQQAALEGNWIGPDPIIRLFHAIIDHPTIKGKFLTRLNSMTRLSLENRNSELCRDISVWEDVANQWNNPAFIPTTESFTNNLHPDYIIPHDIPHTNASCLATATPQKCEDKFNAVILHLKRIIIRWERSGQGEGEFLHDHEGAQQQPEFGSLANQSENALANRANFVGEGGTFFICLGHC